MAASLCPQEDGDLTARVPALKEEVSLSLAALTLCNRPVEIPAASDAVDDVRRMIWAGQAGFWKWLF